MYTISNTYQYPINPLTFSPIKETQPIIVPMIAYNPYAGSTGGGAAMPNSLYPYSSILVTVPSMGNTDLSLIPRNTEQPKATDAMTCLSRQIQSGRPQIKRKRHRYSAIADSKLSNLDPNSIETLTFPENAVGFTTQQRKMLDQQLRMHVQLSTQSFLQVYAHPNYFNRQQIFRNFLVSFQKKRRKESLRIQN